MKESYMVLGLGRFGEAVSKSLYAKGYEVLAIDEDEEIINEIQNHVTHAIVGDCTDESVLKAVGARNFDGAIVAVGGKIETSILSTVLLRELGVNFIVARAATELHGRILKRSARTALSCRSGTWESSLFSRSLRTTLWI